MIDGMSFSILGKNQLGEAVFDILLEAIITGQMSPGDSLPINEISEELGVSNTPIREALNKLENLRLIEKIPYHGYKIREFSKKEVEDIYETRIALESFGASLAAKRIDREKSKELNTLQEKIEDLLEGKPEDFLNEYNMTHKKFHETIIDASNNSQLNDIYNRISHLSTFLASLLATSTTRHHNAIDEHRVIVTAIINGNQEKAGEVMKEHIEKSRELIINKWEESFQYE